MSCPYYKKEDVRNLFNKLVAILGGKPLKQIEFEDSNMRKYRQGIDYFAMEQAYYMWDVHSEEDIDAFISKWDGKVSNWGRPDNIWKYGKDSDSKSSFIQNKVWPKLIDTIGDGNKFKIKINPDNLWISIDILSADINKYNHYVQEIKQIIDELGGSYRDFNFRLADSKIIISFNRMLNALPGVSKNIKSNENVLNEKSSDITVDQSPDTRISYLYSIIKDAPSEEVAEEWLRQYYDVDLESDIQLVLGRFIRNKCKGE